MIDHTGVIVRRDLSLFEGYKFYLVGYDYNHNVVAAAKDIVMEDYKVGAMMPDSGVTSFSDVDAQKIMDELWNNGVRPTGYNEPRGQIQAMQNHIEDLRVVAKIVPKGNTREAT